ncbi:MAG: NnrU family protein [Candidatus Caenarcaniphilales bacterium]|nr:NnrU family protein [Candidatus Caenarcaniphilales bacterium]
MSHLIIVLFAVIFAFAHSGMAAIRPSAEKYIPPRIYRVLFVIVSFLVATPWLVYLVNHRYDGIILFNFQNSEIIHLIVLILASLAFFFLYPGTFRFSEIVTINKPTQRFYTKGIMRITRHPQLTGMSLWCLSHFLWVGSTFMIATSFGLIGYHLFAAWHSDHRRLKLFGQDYQNLIDQTSIFPFKAIFQGKQSLPISEFVDKAYFWVIVFISTVYYFHPWIYENFPKWNI